MSGYDVQIEEIRSASRAARSAAQQRGAVGEAGVLDGVRLAMVGSRSTELLARVEVRWRQAADYWHGTMGGHADALGWSADAYAANEESAARDFRVISGDSGNARPI
ncbi:hypothetical protein [Actinokineospora sp.]|uniref:hypothetical protein n=1 Tax=Actinokineospora sp. TaxID=1872133 RepID=UPI003D6C57C0